jgi:hypothetical protein
MNPVFNLTVAYPVDISNIVSNITDIVNMVIIKPFENIQIIDVATLEEDVVRALRYLNDVDYDIVLDTSIRVGNVRKMPVTTFYIPLGSKDLTSERPPDFTIAYTAVTLVRQPVIIPPEAFPA